MRNRFLAILSAFFILMAGSGIGAAADEPIQTAGNNSTSDQYNLASTNIQNASSTIAANEFVQTAENNSTLNQYNLVSAVQSSSPTVTETRITTNPSNSWNPSIYGNKIVWEDDRNGNWDIYIYDLSTHQEIHTTNKADQHSPDIYGNMVVWTDLRNGGSDIYLQDLSTKKQTRITTSGSAYGPKIYGNRIIWEEFDDNPGVDYSLGIYMYDISTKKKTQITSSISACGPDIYGNNIVWQDSHESYEGDIYVYDLSTKKETQLTHDELTANPAIYGNKIVWENLSYEGDIHVYDLSTKKESRITTSQPVGDKVSIYDNRIVWTDNRNESWDIYMYDLSTSKETQITTNEFTQYGPDIYGNKIVWVEEHNEESDIYMATIGQSIPNADFSASSTSGNAPLTVKFTDKSTGSPTAWKWNFGDGAPLVNEYNPTHTYSKPGTYTVKETVSNAEGKDTEIKTNYITVTAPLKAPVADFSASSTSGNAPLKVKFTDKSTGSPTAWKWSFGDGSALVTQYNPTYTYTKPGTYTVKETVSNAAGKDTEIKTKYITVKAAPIKPIAAFSASPTSGKNPLKVQFTDKSTGTPTSWKWSFGDGTYSTSRNPAHKYSKAGKYAVSLTVKNANGSNTKTISGYITVKK